ncbi:MAG: alcohol dehydrogenase catalytic domain-containing protein [Xenococcus sp. (in: cyanobacteria)]
MNNTTKFQAYAVLNAGEKLQPWEYEPAPLQSGEVEIRVTHNGLCHTDLHMRDDDWNISQFPLVAGHEVVADCISFVIIFLKV